METANTTFLECLECKAAGQNWATEHPTPVVARRALALHRMKAHGIRSEKAKREAARKERLAASGGVPAPKTPTRKTLEDLGPCPPLAESKERSSWMKARWRILHPQLVAAQRQRCATRRREVRVELSAEEKSHKNQLQEASWWKVERAEQSPIKLSECPCCGARFIALKKASQ